MTLAAQDGAGGPVRADERRPSPLVQPTRLRRLQPTKLAYLIGPAAFVVIMLLMRFGYAARVSPWVWVGVFVAIPLVNVVADRFYSARPSGLSLHVRVASQVAAVTTAIYLTGWGPVLWAAYAFMALENVATGGSRVWRTTAVWSLVGMRSASSAIARGLVPLGADASAGGRTDRHGRVRPLLHHPDGRRHHGAEGGRRGNDLRLSEDRFRSLIQNSSDVTMILGDMSVFRYVSPGDQGPAAVRARRADRASGDRLRPSRRPRLRPPDCWAVEFESGQGTATLEFRMIRKDGTTRATSRRWSPTRRTGPRSPATSPTSGTSPSGRSSKHFWPTGRCTIP